MLRKENEYHWVKAWTDEEKRKFCVSVADPEKMPEGQKTQAATAIKDEAAGFDAKEYLDRLKQNRETKDVFEKIKQGKGTIDLDELEAALKEVGFRYKD